MGQGRQRVGDDDSDCGRLYEDDDANELGQDPVRCLHDTRETAGGEAGLIDTYSVDTLEAEQMGVNLDSADECEAKLD